MLPKQSNLSYHNQNIQENAKPKSIAANAMFAHVY